MVLISFSVPHLWELLWSGLKRRTMRPYMYEGQVNKKGLAVVNKFHRKSPVFLQLYWKSRSPNGQYLFTVPLIDIRILRLKDLSEIEWQQDGFQNSIEGKSWFATQYMNNQYDPEFKVFVYQWGIGKCNQCAYQKKCRNQQFGSKLGVDYYNWGETPFCPNFDPEGKPFRWRTLPEIHENHRVLELSKHEREELLPFNSDEEAELLDEEIGKRQLDGYRYRYRCPHCAFEAEYFHVITIHMSISVYCRQAELSSPCYPILLHTPAGAPIP